MYFPNRNLQTVKKSVLYVLGNTLDKGNIVSRVYYRNIASSVAGTVQRRSPLLNVANDANRLHRNDKLGGTREITTQCSSTTPLVESSKRFLNQASEQDGISETKDRCLITVLNSNENGFLRPFCTWLSSNGTKHFGVISANRFLFRNLAQRAVGGTALCCRRYASSVASDYTVGKQNSAPRSFKEVPGPGGLQALPIVGLILQLKPFTEFSPSNFAKLQDHWYKKYGPLVKVRMGTTWVCHVFDPKDIEAIYRVDGRYPRRLPFPLSEAYYRKRGLPPGMVVLNGEAWREQRRAVQSVIQRPSVVRQYVPQVSNLADELVDTFKGGSEIRDVFQRLLPFTIEALSLLLFNKRLGCIDESNVNRKEIMYYSELLLDSFSRQYEKPAWFFNFKSKLYDDYEKSFDFLRSIAHDSLIEAQEKMKRAEIDGDEMETNATMLLLKRSNVPLEKLKSTLLELFSGGIDATAGSTAFVLFHLARHKDIQEQVYQEVKDLTSTTLTADDLQKVPYLKACVKESFRLVFPVPGGPTRILDKDVTLSGYNIPKNTPLQICSGTACRDEKYFPDPESFLPERWLRGVRDDREERFAFIPFGHGPRNCVGQRFAEVEIQILIVKLIQTFKFTLPEGVTEAPLMYTTFAKPATPLTLRIQPR